MQKINQNLIDEVVSKVPLHAVIARETGTVFIPSQEGYKGLCPFHREKTPSFVIYNSTRPNYICFGAGCGEKGNVLTFLMKWKGIGFREAFGYARELANVPEDRYSPSEQKTLLPVPQQVKAIPWNLPAISPDIELPTVGESILVYNPRKGTTHINTPSHVHVYRNTDGNPLLVVLRFNRQKGGKYFHQVTWKKESIPTHPHINGHWYQIAFEPNMQRPLYGMQDIPQWQQMDGRFILFVEGEKTRDAAIKMLPLDRLGVLILCNLGSTGAITKIDWTSLMEALQISSSNDKPANIIFWPDADAVLDRFDGTTVDPQEKFVAKWKSELLKAMEEYGLDPNSIRIRKVFPEKDRESGWDLADALQDGWSKDDFIKWYLGNSTLITDDNPDPNV